MPNCEKHNIPFRKGRIDDGTYDYCIHCVKENLYPKIGYKTYHPEVERFHASNAKIKVCSAPRRSTKSYSAAHEVMPYCTLPGMIIWCMGPNYEVASKEFMVVHKKLVVGGAKAGIPPPKSCYINSRAGKPIITWDFGNNNLTTIECKSADNLESTLGSEVDIIIYGEAAQLKSIVRDQFTQPTLNTRDGIEIIPSTPKGGAKWMKDLYDLGYDDEFPWIESFHWDVSGNPIYNYDQMKRAIKEKGIDHPAIREQYFGEWVFYGGLVYPVYSEDLHVIKPFKIPKHWTRFRAIDFGSRDPFCCLWFSVGEEGEIYVYDEYYYKEGDRALPRHAAEIKLRTGNDNISYTVADQSGRQQIDDLCYYGIPTTSATNDPPSGRARVLEYLQPSTDGIMSFPMREKVAKYKSYAVLKDEDAITSKQVKRNKWPRIYFFDTCKDTMTEFNYYRYKEGRQVEGDKEKTEGNDHAMTTLHFGLLTRPSPFKMVKDYNPNTFTAIMEQMLYDERVANISI